MECEENGDGVKAVAGRRGVKRKRGAAGTRDVQLALAPALLGAPRCRTLRPPMQPRRIPTPTLPPDQPPLFPPPFFNVNLMEEITFWVCTRRAPCLYRYKNLYKKKPEDPHCSKYRHSSDPSVSEEVPSPKKKKRRVRLLDDDESLSGEGYQNIYFERSQKQYNKSWYSTSKSDSDGSDVDFNIRNASIPNKSKTSKQLRKTRVAVPKKNKMLTSTPKPTTLRRSLRKSQQNINYSSQLDGSFEILNSSAINGEHQSRQRENVDEKDKSANKDQTCNNRKDTVLKEQLKNEIVPNGQFEDISDVSGFTANYIRSTKMNSKTPQKVRNKTGRNLVRESQQKLQKDESKIIVCVNKSVNTGLPTPVLNDNTDSSPNVINLITVNNNNNEKSLKVNRTTSHLKLLDIKNDEAKVDDKDGGQMNISFQSKSSGVSRYPTRHRNNSKVVAQDFENTNQHSTLMQKKLPRELRELKIINQNEGPDVSLVSRTRSGKRIGVIQMDFEESGCSQGRVNNVADHVSSSVSKNVATPVNKSVGKKKRATSTKKAADVGQEIGKDSVSDNTKNTKKDPGGLASSSSRAKCGGTKAVNKTRQSLRKDSLRDKSGFAACFSDSDEDKPLIRRKFFC